MQRKSHSPPTTLTHYYAQQFSTLAEQREQMRELVASWWTIPEDRPH